MLTVLLGGRVQGAAEKVAGRTGKHWSAKLINFAVARGLVKSAHRVFELDGTIYEATEGEVFAEEVVP